MDLSKRTSDTDYSKEELRLVRLTAECRTVHCFEYQGCVYLGDSVSAVKQFIKDNPTAADFHVWLQNNIPQLIER